MTRNGADDHQVYTEKQLVWSQLASLNIAKFETSYVTRGLFYTVNLSDELELNILAAAGLQNGGTRTFSIRRSEGSTNQPVHRVENGALTFVGIFLMVLGLFGFFIRIFEFAGKYMLASRGK